MQASHYDLLQGKFERLTRIDTPQGPVFIERGINFDITNFLDVIPYSQVLGNLICQAITNGKSKLAAIKELNLEYATVRKWVQGNEEFELALKQAEKDRADYIGEEALQIARLEGDSGRLLELAAIGDPDKFGKKTKLLGDAANPIQFIIETGIRKSRDAGALTHEQPQKIEEMKNVTPKDGVEEYAGEASKN